MVAHQELLRPSSTVMATQTPPLLICGGLFPRSKLRQGQLRRNANLEALLNSVCTAPLGEKLRFGDSHCLAFCRVGICLCNVVVPLLWKPKGSQVRRRFPSSTTMAVRLSELLVRAVFGGVLALRLPLGPNLTVNASHLRLATHAPLNHLLKVRRDCTVPPDQNNHPSLLEANREQTKIENRHTPHQISLCKHSLVPEQTH